MSTCYWSYLVEKNKFKLRQTKPLHKISSNVSTRKLFPRAAWELQKQHELEKPRFLREEKWIHVGFSFLAISFSLGGCVDSWCGHQSKNPGLAWGKRLKRCKQETFYSSVTPEKQKRGRQGSNTSWCLHVSLHSSSRLWECRTVSRETVGNIQNRNSSIPNCWLDFK